MLLEQGGENLTREPSIDSHGLAKNVPEKTVSPTTHANSEVPLRSWQTIVPPVLSSDMPTALTGLDHALPLHSSMFAHLVLIRHKANSTATIVSMIENRKPERFHLEETEQGIASHTAPDWRDQLEDMINREAC